MKRLDAILRRMMELIGSAIGLLSISPALLAIAAAIKFLDRGPVIYIARRVGRGGKTISVFKFRTMVVGADRLGKGITSHNDTRITTVGRWLRRTKLDELPQLFNVLSGEMGLVGPRPEDPRYVALYTSEQRAILEFRPGITSPASLQFRREEELLQGNDWERVYIETIMPAKLAVDLEYLSRRTVFTDLQVVLRTIARLFGIKCVETKEAELSAGADPNDGRASAA